MRAAAFVVTLVGAAGCSGNSPTAPTPPAPTPNRAPVIAAATVTPAFGIAKGVTTYTYAASASDPDGDVLTYRWELPSETAQDTPTATTTYQNPGQMTAKLIVTDGKNGRAEAQVNAVAASLDGLWTSTSTPVPNWIVQIRIGQVGADVYATLGDNAHPPNIGHSDPGEIGKIDAVGQFWIRFKIGHRPDVYIRGRLEPPGDRIVGVIDRSGFNNDPIAFQKEP